MGARTPLPEALRDSQPGFEIRIDRNDDRDKYVILDTVKNYRNVYYRSKKNYYDRNNRSDDSILRELCIDYCMRFGLTSYIYSG